MQISGKLSRRRDDPNPAPAGNSALARLVMRGHGEPMNEAVCLFGQRVQLILWRECLLLHPFGESPQVSLQWAELDEDDLKLVGGEIVTG